MTKFDIKNRWSVLTRAVRAGVLRDADRMGHITGADITRAVVLRGVPKIERIHQAVYAAASMPGALDMGAWHAACGTTHCRAGWVTTLAGDAGKDLERRVGTSAAAALVYLASDPSLGRVPDFCASNTAALADMKARADAEAGRPT